MNEASKAHKRRSLDPRYSEWISGKVLDVGCGNDCITREMYPSIDSVTGYDIELGHTDATTLPELAGELFDCIHASHLLEHLNSPQDAVLRWIDLLAPGGHIVVTIPEWGMYEQGVWPSTWNSDHKTAWVVNKGGLHLEPHVVDVSEFLADIVGKRDVEVLLVRKCEDGFDFSKETRVDQTLGDAESAIEFVVRKIPPERMKPTPVKIPETVAIMMIQHMGLGDAMICNAITRRTVEAASSPVGLFVNPAYRESIGWMYRDLGDNLVLVDAPTRPPSGVDDFGDLFAICDHWGGQVVNVSMFRENRFIFAEEGERFDKCFYKAAGMDFQEKFSGFHYERDESIELPPIDNCILLHDDKERNFPIDTGRIDSPPERITTVDEIGESNIFALRRIIEEAEEIHVINSAFLNFIDFLEPKGKLYWHYYPRAWVGVSDPELQLDWKVLK